MIRINAATRLKATQVEAAVPEEFKNLYKTFKRILGKETSTNNGLSGKDTIFRWRVTPNQQITLGTTLDGAENYSWIEIVDPVSKESFFAKAKGDNWMPKLIKDFKNQSPKVKTESPCSN